MVEAQAHLDAEDYVAFHARICQLRQVEALARSAELTARQEYTAKRAARERATQELLVAIDAFNRPLPLFNTVADAAECPDLRTLLRDLPGVPAEAADALARSEILSVQDLLLRADLMEANGRMAGTTGRARLYGAARSVVGVSAAWATTIETAIVAAGYTVDGPPPAPEPKNAIEEAPADLLLDPPACACCHAEGSPVDQPELADEDTDLIPGDLVDCDVLDAMEFREEVCEGFFICAQCIQKAKAQIEEKSKPARQRKAKRYAP